MSDEVCPFCNGSGEGLADGTTCHDCGGDGTYRERRDNNDIEYSENPLMEHDNE